MPAKVARGEIKYREDRTIGLEHVGEAFHAMQTGENTAGKSVIIVAEE
jgi:NADPH-dependent curcumin reductase CurA